MTNNLYLLRALSFLFIEERRSKLTKGILNMLEAFGLIENWQISLVYFPFTDTYTCQGKGL